MKSTLAPLYLLTAGISGLLFGSGLYIAQMVDPLKVLRFLDFTAIPEGGWDPSLALVMGPAVVIMFVAIRLTQGKTRPLFNGKFHRPDFTKIDAPLVLGSALFGVGWGMSGICPGPAIVIAGFMPENLLYFLIPMFAGSFLGSYILRWMTARTEPANAQPQTQN